VRFWYLRRPPGTVQDEVDEELRIHLEMRIEELRATGLSPDAARKQAIQDFGDIEGTRRYCQRLGVDKENRVQRLLFVQDLAQDVRIGVRNLLRAPALALTVVGTVGLGIGATTAIFAAVNAALLQPLPYRNPEQLVRIYTDAAPNKFSLSVADYLALEAQQTHFDVVAGSTGRVMAFSNGTTAERLTGREVTWTYFRLLGIAPSIGRDLSEQDGRPGSPRTVVISHGFWERLGSRPDIVGQPIRLDGTDYVVAGVLPAQLGPLEQRRDFFIAAQWSTPRRKGPFFVTTLGRLRQGVSRSAATSELHAINSRLFPLWKSSYQDDRATWNLTDLKAFVAGDIQTVAGVALAAVVLVWLIATANAASLLVARVTSRRRELAVRAALGASRGRVVRYLLAESGVLAVGAAAVGFSLAWGGVRLLQTAGAAYFPRTQEMGLRGPALWLLGAVTIASGVLFGLVPALYGGGGPVDESLRSIGRSATGSLAIRRLRRGLVASQFAIATPLLVGAGLLLVSLSDLRRVDLGFDTRNVLTGAIQLPAAQYPQNASVVFWDELKRRVEALPGVSALAFSDGRPPDDVDNFNNFDLEDQPTPAGASQPVTPWVAVTPEYFRVLGLPLLEGRLVDERDARTEDLESVVVDRAWARRFSRTRVRWASGCGRVAARNVRGPP
jgi:putative ABC transport system permease protein